LNGAEAHENSQCRSPRSENTAFPHANKTKERSPLNGYFSALLELYAEVGDGVKE